MDYQLCWENAVDLSKRIRSGELSVAEVTETHLAAIDEFNPAINAVVTIDGEGARKAASEVQAKIDAGKLDDSALAGAPFLAKDLDVTAGVRTTFGSLIHNDYVPGWDMHHIARLKAAGCVMLGKTNTPEDGLIPNTYNPVFGTTRNPWNLDRCPGGSSGGAGAAVVAGLAPLAAGSDGGGSIRVPASLNGCFGFKPTFGSIPFGPKGIGVMNTIGHLGPLTRTVSDGAAMMDVMAGDDERDRGSVRTEGGLLAALAGAFEPKRIAFSLDLGYGKPDAEVARLFGEAIGKLQAAGWPLEEAQPGFADPLNSIETIIAFEWGTIPMKLKAENREAYELQADYVKALAEARTNLTIDQLWDAYGQRKNVAVAMGRFFEEFDLLITPTLMGTAFELEQPWPMKDGEPDTGLTANVYPFNLTGDPACSIPMGNTSEGLPVGLQIVGPRYEDARLLRAAKAIEEIGLTDALRPLHGVKVGTAA